MTYKLKDGRVSAYYGDTNVTLELAGISTGTEVQFRKNAEDTWNVTIENGEVAIPNEFFNGTYSKIIFYVTDGANTIGKGSIDVIPRTFPSDYSYEPTKIRTYEGILAEMKGYDDSAKETLEKVEAIEDKVDDVNINMQRAETAADNAEASAKSASESLQSVQKEAEDVEAAGTKALQDISDAKESALSSVTTQETNSKKAVQDLGDSITLGLNSQNDTILGNISQAKSDSVGAVEKAQTAAEDSISLKQTGAVSAVEKAQTVAVDKISSDQTAALQAIDTAKNSAVDAVNKDKDTILSDMSDKLTEVNTAGSNAVTAIQEQESKSLQNLTDKETTVVDEMTALKKAASDSADTAAASAKAAGTSESNASKSADAAANTLKECNNIKTEMDGQLSALTAFTVVNGELCIIYYE